MNITGVCPKAISRFFLHHQLYYCSFTRCISCSVTGSEMSMPSAFTCTTSRVRGLLHGSAFFHLHLLGVIVTLFPLTVHVPGHSLPLTVTTMAPSFFRSYIILPVFHFATSILLFQSFSCVGRLVADWAWLEYSTTDSNRQARLRNNRFLISFY